MRIVSKESIVLWLAIAALTCAAVSLNDSLNQLADK